MKHELKMKEDKEDEMRILIVNNKNSKLSTFIFTYFIKLIYYYNNRL